MVVTGSNLTSHYVCNSNPISISNYNSTSNYFYSLISSSNYDCNTNHGPISNFIPNSSLKRANVMKGAATDNRINCNCIQF